MSWYVQMTAELKFLSCLLLCLFVLSCTSRPTPTIVSREAPPSQRINAHEVQAGETIYSIAWRYETDYRDMARINGLREPYELRLGQQLKIYDDGRPAPNSTVAPVADRSVSVRTVPVDPQPEVRSTPTPRQAPAQASSAARTPSASEIGNWRWPIPGRITSSFGSSSLAKGIEIDPGSETNVQAAAEGVVVYAGTGIRGVGNLIIVKHSDLFLSAYAYNSSLLAKEGDSVQAGQRIARVGNDSNGRPRVYFEIRRDGQPVDPIRYLPSR